MLSNSKNIAVNPRTCVDNNCEENCDDPKCELCLTCLSDENLQNLKRAYREHINREGFRRIFPSEAECNDYSEVELTENNRISMKWFEAKCLEDEEFC
jgi:tubulin monoglycylase TTLL15